MLSQEYRLEEGQLLHKAPWQVQKMHQSQAESSGRFENLFRNDQTQGLEIKLDSQLRGKYAGDKWAFHGSFGALNFFLCHLLFLSFVPYLPWVELKT